MTSEAPKLLLTAKQAAAALSISERTLWELTRVGEIPRVKIGAAVRYDVRDLMAWIDKKKRGSAVNATPLEKVLSAVGDYKRSGNSHKARCPAHGDRDPSLSVSEAEDGKVLVNCHAGCTTEKVVRALGLEMRDLFPRVDVDTTPRNTRKKGVSSTAKCKTNVFPSAAKAVAVLEKSLGKRSAWWTYEDAGGDPVAVVARWDLPEGKTFRPVAKIDGGWRIGDPAGPWPLYRLPELLRSTGPVYVVEGEKAADALCALGFTVTTSAHGADAAKGTD